MDRLPAESPALDEQVWRNWVHKGKLRDQARKRRWRIMGGIVIALVLVAGAIYTWLPSN